MSLVGKKIIPFSANAFKNGQFLTVDETTFLGHWSIVCFYPADFTFVCPTELEDLQNHIHEFDELDTQIYSISTDTHYTHKAWHDNSAAIKKITYTMIGDPSHQLAKNFDVLIDEEGLADRGTFIIDPDGIIQSIEVNAGNVGRDASVLVTKIKATQHVRQFPGEACPAKWKSGSKALTPSLDLVGKI